MADWFIATEGVKDSASLWPQIITAVSSAGAALFGVGMTHHFTRRREKDAADRKRQEERRFITTELVFLLERYASAWQMMRWNNLFNGESYPTLDLSGVTGDWRVLDTHQLLRIRLLEADHSELINQLHPRSLGSYSHHAAYRTGLRVFLLAAKLRREAGLPDSANLTFRQVRSAPFVQSANASGIRKYWRLREPERQQTDDGIWQVLLWNALLKYQDDNYFNNRR
ncbi:hypothetical protein [Kosakonia cowanii]|uniref:hypothetical protein n=1 Tax=Kosakonia cowanii TaxID=208223 RepID=UPI0018649FEC|nr:hypothetical protein [Kosakonia cowanii]